MSDCFLVFDSIHHVLAAERAFQQQSIWCDLVPTPRSIDSNCGMVVQARTEDVPQIKQLVADLTRKPRSVYKLVDREYQVLDS